MIKVVIYVTPHKRSSDLKMPLLENVQQLFKLCTYPFLSRISDCLGFNIEPVISNMAAIQIATRKENKISGNHIDQWSPNSETWPEVRREDRLNFQRPHWERRQETCPLVTLIEWPCHLSGEPGCDHFLQPESFFFFLPRRNLPASPDVTKDFISVQWSEKLSAPQGK